MDSRRNRDGTFDLLYTSWIIIGLKKQKKNARTFIIGPTADTLLCMISSLPSHLVILPGSHFNS